MTVHIVAIACMGLTIVMILDIIQKIRTDNGVNQEE